MGPDSSFEKPTIQADNPVSQRAADDKYADLSVNKDLVGPAKPQAAEPTPEETSETRTRQPPPRTETVAQNQIPPNPKPARTAPNVQPQPQER